MKAFALALLAAPAIVAGAPALDSLLRGKYLDIHCHTAGIGAGGSGCFASKAFHESYKYPIYLKAFGVTEKELVDSGDALVIARISRRLAASTSVGAAVVLALDGVYDSAGRLDTGKTQIFIPDDFVARETRKYPNLLFGASVNPRRADALTELQWAKTRGAVLVKWLPSIMDFDPGDSAFIPFYRKLIELGLPLLCHTGTEKSFLRAKDSLCDPYRLELPLKLGVTVIAAHVGTPGKSHGQPNMERALDLLGRYPNFYADISSLTQINKLTLLAKILPRREARGKLLYGTDYPLIETPLVSSWYYAYKLPLTRVRAVAALENSWDRDVALKKALGVGDDVFTRPAELLLKNR